MSKKSLSQQVADDIYTLIVEDKEFKPGDQLPNENDLSERLGVSRATLREAIRILVSQGVLDVYRGKGTFVALDMKPFKDYGLGNLERVRMHLKDLFEARLLFEPEMAALACRRATDKEMAEIIRLGEIVEQTILSGEDRTEVDQNFHSAIVTAAHNEFMLRLLPIINHAIEGVIRTNVEYHALAEGTIQDHALLIRFLKERDAGGAKQALSIHLHHAINTLGLNSAENPIY